MTKKEEIKFINKIDKLTEGLLDVLELVLSKEDIFKYEINLYKKRLNRYYYELHSKWFMESYSESNAKSIYRESIKKREKNEINENINCIQNKLQEIKKEYLKNKGDTNE